MRVGICDCVFSSLILIAMSCNAILSYFLMSHRITSQLMQCNVMHIHTDHTHGNINGGGDWTGVGGGMGRRMMGGGGMNMEGGALTRMPSLLAAPPDSHSHSHSLPPPSYLTRQDSGEVRGSD
jgi:hypothetical protein